MQPPLRRESETGRPGLAFQFGPCSSGAARPASPLLSRQRPLPAHAYPLSSRWHGYSCPCAPRWWPASPQMAHCALFLPVRAPLVVEARKDNTTLGIPARARPAVPRSCPCPPRRAPLFHIAPSVHPTHRNSHVANEQANHATTTQSAKSNQSDASKFRQPRTPKPGTFLFRHSGFLFRHSGESRNPGPCANMTLWVR